MSSLIFLVLLLGEKNKKTSVKNAKGLDKKYDKKVSHGNQSALQ